MYRQCLLCQAIASAAPTVLLELAKLSSSTIPCLTCKLEAVGLLCLSKVTSSLRLLQLNWMDIHISPSIIYNLNPESQFLFEDVCWLWIVNPKPNRCSLDFLLLWTSPLTRNPHPKTELNPNCQPHTVIIPSIKIIMVILFRFNLFLNKSWCHVVGNVSS